MPSSGTGTEAWIKGAGASPLKADDLIGFLSRCWFQIFRLRSWNTSAAWVHIARDSAKANDRLYGPERCRSTRTVVIAGAILADVGKLLEYEIGPDGKSRQSERGRSVAPSIHGVALAMECGVARRSVPHHRRATPPKADLVKRNVRSVIVHHADFMAFCRLRIRRMSK